MCLAVIYILGGEIHKASTSDLALPSAEQYLVITAPQARTVEACTTHLQDIDFMHITAWSPVPCQSG